MNFSNCIEYYYPFIMITFLNYICMYVHFESHYNLYKEIKIPSTLSHLRVHKNESKLAHVANGGQSQSD